MIIFSGWGLLLVPIALLGAVVGGGLAGATNAATPSALAVACGFGGGCVAGALSWWLGSKTRASLMFIPAKAWAVIFPIVFAALGFIGDAT